MLAIPQGASAQTAAPAVSATNADQAGDIVVTAQKRRESINDVGMSISAATGDQLRARGVADVSDLAKVVPGFNYNSTSYGMPVYTIRGVGFQESSLAASPAVSIYVDEIPLPYPAETLGATLDLERVEVLKGPQGTLYGQNATGGAINYIAAKPTTRFSAGVNASYGRFNTVDLSGFVSGPISDSLGVRVALRTVQSGAWQKSYTRSDSLGATNKLQGRVLFDWRPTDRLTISLNLNAWRDRSDTPAAQAVGILSQSTPAALFPAVAVAPLAPADARAADWNPGISYQRDNRFYQAAARIDYKILDSVTLSSITSYQNYKRDAPNDGDGTQYQVIYFRNYGHIYSIFQELRLAGSFGAKGNWIIGGNYEYDKTSDNSAISFNQSSTRAVGDALNENTQNVKTMAAYANVDYPILPGVDLLAGVRYTEADRSFVGCTHATNAVSAATIFHVPLGACLTALADGTVGFATTQFNQNNVSWRAGLNYKASDGILLYGNVSKGWKAGGFPILSALSYAQVQPIMQESLLAYEAGFKVNLFSHTLQLNGAYFYYDYTNKQIRGKTRVPVFGIAETLVNVPKSHVQGFELSATWKPVQGLTIAPSITLVSSKVDGSFINYTSAGTLGDFAGEAFPYTPKWSGNTDVEYRWPVGHTLQAFLGGNVSYQTATNGSFGELADFRVRGYALLDLRAGVEAPDGRWRASVWGRNVTNQYYWTTAAHFGDTNVRFAGMPVTYGLSFSYRY